MYLVEKIVRMEIFDDSSYFPTAREGTRMDNAIFWIQENRPETET